MLNKKRIFNMLENNSDIAILPIGFIVVTLIMVILSSGKFLNPNNISSIAFQLPELGLFTMAIMISMVTGGIDLSIISIANLSGVIMALCFKKFLELSNQSPGMLFFYISLVLIIGLFVSIILGLANGIFIAYIEVSPILTTLGTMILYEGLTLSITKGFVISGFPQKFLDIGSGSTLGIPNPFLIFIGCALILHIIFKYRPLGKYFFMIGSNREATEYSGINTKVILLKAYVLSGLFAGVAAIIMLSRFNSANARYGTSYLLISALLSIMGGTDPDGGTGKVIGIVMAVIVLQVIASGLNLLGISSFVSVALWGLLLILVMFYRKYAQSYIYKRNRKN